MDHYRTGNILLDSLPGSAIERIAPLLHEQHFSRGHVLYPGFDSESEIGSVYFPTTAVTSMAALLSEGDHVEALPIGYEGLAGFQALFGSARTAEHWICAVPGTAFRMAVADFWAALTEFAPLGRIMLCYSQSLITGLACSVACNTKHPIAARCAKWFLMTHDRVPGDAFFMTHESLAVMLGVRRASITVVAMALQRAGLIRYSRGIIEITDRAGLEHAACECYEKVATEYRRLMLRSSNHARAKALFTSRAVSAAGISR
jgi:CRP-like cAMP-binding protein